MKHPVRDRVLMVLCALCAFSGAAALIALLIGKLSLSDAGAWISAVDMTRISAKAAAVAGVIVLILLGLLLISAVLPSRRKRSSNFAIQRNENGMVRISLKALETLVQKCLNQHAELKVVTSSLYSDEETIRVDVHISLQSDISMPLAISALQKQIKKYLEACSGVMVSEVRVFVDSTIPATEETAQSPYAIPQSLLGLEAETLPAVEAGKPDAAAQQETPPDAGMPDEQQPAVIGKEVDSVPEEAEEPAVWSEEPHDKPEEDGACAYDAGAADGASQDAGDTCKEEEKAQADGGQEKELGEQA